MNVFKNFIFDHSKVGMIGVEREFFIKESDGDYTPKAVEVLIWLDKYNQFTHEISSFQIESRVGPCNIRDLRTSLVANAEVLRIAEKELGVTFDSHEVASKQLPIQLYPDSRGRYKAIWDVLSEESRAVICQHIGTHIHVGMPDIDAALQAHNRAIDEIERLNAIGNHSAGTRLAQMLTVNPKLFPKKFGSVDEWWADYEANGYHIDPRGDWRIIRISHHGSLEFRNFGATEKIDEVENYAKLCLSICAPYL